MPDLFEQTNIKSMQLKNRLVRSATFERMCDKDGYPTNELLNLYEKLAKGGVGLIITGFATVSKNFRTPFTSRIDEDELISKYKKITDKVHEYDCCIAMQINHPGRQTTKSDTGNEPIAPSAVNCRFPESIPREMTEEEIESVINDYVNAAVRIKEAGFDAIQLHGAAGYLINQFLSPYTNRRTDQWGGSLENRIRFMKEIYFGCRQNLGENYPILIKLNSHDNMKHGLKLDEGIKIAEMASVMGFDAIEVSSGIFEDGLSTLCGDFPADILIDDFHAFDDKPVMRFLMRHFGKKLMKMPNFTPEFNREAARLIKQKVNIPVFNVGGIHDPKAMIDVLEQKDADYISLSRPLIADPGFPAKIKKGILLPSKCIQCNHCFFYLMKSPLKCHYGKRIIGDIENKALHPS
jgi:2,4-dienoyl-CoA reductase-like NADH-dependent reductase (Old Yellow Enzyme family)